jgi:hypothetical protein
MGNGRMGQDVGRAANFKPRLEFTGIPPAFFCCYTLVTLRTSAESLASNFSRSS